MPKPDWDSMSNASLGTGAAFKNDIGIGTLFLKDGQYNTEFLQTFITKPLSAGRPPPKPIRQPTTYSEVPLGYQPRTIIYFKQQDLATDPQRREKYHILSKEQQEACVQKAVAMKEVLFEERRKVRKAWNTPVESPGSIGKPPPRVTPSERAARKAKAVAEADNHGALVETITVPDDAFGAGRWGKRMEIIPSTKIRARAPGSGSATPYNPGSYDTPTSPAKSQFGDGPESFDLDPDDLERYRRPQKDPILENATANELRLLTAARSREMQAAILKKKVNRLEHFVGGLKRSLIDLKDDPDKGVQILSAEATALGEKGLLGTAGGELAAAIAGMQRTQQLQTEAIEALRLEKQAAEARAKKLEREILTNYKESKRAERAATTAAAETEASTGAAPAGASSKARSKTTITSHIESLKNGQIIEYVTDVEGNYDYWQTYLSRSKVVFQLEDGTYDLHPSTYFVFGGDACDKGLGDIRFVKGVVALKNKYPDRVFFILGNRDLNKLRFVSELADGRTGEGTDIYWDKSAEKFVAFCERNGLEEQNKVSTLKWMLHCTMGCPTTFETRRSELAILRNREDGGREGDSDVTDEDVLKSLVDSVDPAADDHFMLDFVKLGQIMLVIGDCLFVHGGVTASTLGKIPGGSESSEETPAYLGVREWAAGLNAWKSSMVSEYGKNPGWKEDGVKRTFDPLLDYSVPAGNGNSTVIYNNHLKNGNSAQPDVEVEEYFLEEGVRRLFVGHQPVGECVGVVKRNDLSIFMCDTSYSNMSADKSTNPANNRGDVCSLVTIEKHLTRVEGALKDPSLNNSYVIYVDESRNDLPFSLVGRQLTNDCWVKGVVDGKCYVAKGEGFKLECKFMSCEDVMDMLKPLPKIGFGAAMMRRSAGSEPASGGQSSAGAKGFTERQAEFTRKSQEKKEKTVMEDEAERIAKLNSFKAKLLAKGETKKKAEEQAKKDAQKREDKEVTAKSDAVVSLLLSKAPPRMQQHSSGTVTEAQRRGLERKEKAKAQAEKMNALV